jgi:hypothetical protein
MKMEPSEEIEREGAGWPPPNLPKIGDIYECMYHEECDFKPHMEGSRYMRVDNVTFGYWDDPRIDDPQAEIPKDAERYANISMWTAKYTKPNGQLDFVDEEHYKKAAPNIFRYVHFWRESEPQNDMTQLDWWKPISEEEYHEAQNS